jgi:hypothetical protein
MEYIGYEVKLNLFKGILLRKVLSVCFTMIYNKL